VVVTKEVAKKEIQKRKDLKISRLRKSFPRLWLAEEHHLTVHNKPMDFGDKYRFLIPLYRLEERDICYEKSVQVGVSELMIVSTLHEAGEIGLRILYVMPNMDLRGKFVKDRLDRLLKTVPYYDKQVREAIGESTSIGMKHFGKGLLNFVGSNSPAEFTSYPADSLYIDEVDKCDQINLRIAPDRLDASDYKFERRAGNPSVENWGIDSAYLESTQETWYIKCEYCNEQQNLSFFENVIRRTGQLAFDVMDEEDGEVFAVCKKCGGRLDRMRGGEWVYTFKERERKGFRINQLFAANIELSSLVRQYSKAISNDRNLQIFYNSKLGLPYSSAGNKITYSLLESVKKNYSIKKEDISIYKRLYVGIDVGAYYHVIVRARLDNNKRKLVAVYKFETTQQLVRMLKQFRNVKFIMIDETPEVREVEKIKKEVKKVYSCRYVNGRTLLDIKKTEKRYVRARKISIDRTFVLDEVRSDFSKGIMINPIDAHDIFNDDLEDYGEYYKNMLSSTRIFIEETGRNRSRFEWRESSPDHFFHAEAYCKMAEMLDPNILQFYEDRTREMAGRTKEEIDAEFEKSKPLIPRISVEEKEAIEEGRLKIEDSKSIKELEVINAETFLRGLFHHSQELLGQRPKKK